MSIVLAHMPYFVMIQWQSRAFDKYIYVDNLDSLDIIWLWYNSPPIILKYQFIKLKLTLLCGCGGPFRRWTNLEFSVIQIFKILWYRSCQHKIEFNYKLKHPTTGLSDVEEKNKALGKGPSILGPPGLVRTQGLRKCKYLYAI